MILPQYGFQWFRGSKWFELFNVKLIFIRMPDWTNKKQLSFLNWKLLYLEKWCFFPPSFFSSQAGWCRLLLGGKRFGIFLWNHPLKFDFDPSLLPLSLTHALSHTHSHTHTHTHARTLDSKSKKDNFRCQQLSSQHSVLKPPKTLLPRWPQKRSKADRGRLEMLATNQTKLHTFRTV